MAQIPPSLRHMPPRVPAAIPWVRGAAPAPVAPAPMPDLPPAPMRFVPTGDKPALTPEAMALNAKYPETAADAICDLMDDVELKRDDEEYSFNPDGDAESEDDEQEEAAVPVEETPAVPVQQAPTVEAQVTSPLPAVEDDDDIDWGEPVPDDLLPRLPPRVPPVPPSSGLMSSRIGVLPAAEGRPPMPPIRPRSPPATGRDT